MNKLKTLAQKFFDTKVGKWILKSMAVLNTLEGVIHLVVAVIGIWGIVATGVSDFRIMLPVIENIILGGLSLLTGWALGLKHNHHEHKE